VGHRQAAGSSAFYTVSSWFLTRTATPGRNAGGIPNNRANQEEFTMMGSYGNGIGSLGWLGIGAFWLIVLGLIVWLVIRLLPSSSGRTTGPTGESALGILDRRLANGEIDMPEWNAQRAALLAASGG